MTVPAASQFPSLSETLSPKYRPISFITPLIQAIIAGRKTQTRRIFPTPSKLVDASHGGRPIVCLFGQPGDRLWVRERWAEAEEATLFGSAVQPIVYAADGLATPTRWKPARFMPRRHSRLTLEIRAIRAESLTDISSADAAAEGFDSSCHADPVAWFRDLWDGLADETTDWAANPKVWVIGFELLDRPISPQPL